ncbi:MAG: fibronectin type III domain-containing protein [Lachnospiraceae bacterium]|nr:fibronectin type III domain-containing protein [Lachnospiraceae bacterium]
MSLKNRIEALVLAALLVVTTLFAGQKIQANYEGVGSDASSYVSTGGSIAQVIKSSATNYETVNGGSFKLHLDENQTVNYKVAFYQNLTDELNPESGERVCEINSASPVTGTGETTIDFSAPSTITVANGETFSVVITLTSATGRIIYYKNPGSGVGTGYSKEASGGWSPMGGSLFNITTTATDSASDITSISLNETNIYLDSDDDETETLVATLKPAYLRTVTFSSDNENVATVDTTSGVVQKSNSTGKATITATAGGKSATANAYVIKSQLASNAYTYDGTAKEPAVTVTCGSALTLGNDYTVSYEDNVDVGTAKAIITGKGIYAGYSKTLEYSISAATFDQTTVDAAIFGIDISTGTVTTATVGSLVMGVDFVVSAIQTGAAANGNPIYTVTVTGIGNYAGTEVTRENYEVTASASSAIDISSVVDVKLPYTNVAFDGSQKKPEVTYISKYDGETELASFKDNVKISYGENIKAGKGTVVITGDSTKGYTGSITKEFTIDKRKISTVTANITDADGNIVASDGSGIFVHTGSAIEPVATLSIDNSDGTAYNLTKGTDYEVEYVNNKNINNRMEMVITGKGNFKGTNEIYFKIIGDFEKDPIVSVGGTSAVTVKDKVAASTYSTVYTGASQTPSVVIEMGDVELSVGDDYSLEYTSNKDAGTANIVVTGLGKYEGKSFNITYAITPKTLAGSISVVRAKRYFTGAEITLPANEMTVVSGGKKLTAGTDYEISYADNVDAGDATVTATGVGNYKGTLSTTFTISPVDITGNEDLTIELDKYQFEYTGNQIKPEVTVKYKGNTLREGTDYSLEWTDNIMVGQATVTVNGAGNLTGSKSENFDITPKGFGGLTFTIGGEPVTFDGTNWSTTYSATYTGFDIKPEIVAMDGNKKVYALQSYLVSYSNNVNAGTATVSIDGVGVYKDAQATINFTINPKDINDETVELTSGGTEKRTINEKTYTFPKVSLKDDSLVVKGLKEKTEDYPSGAYTITVTDDSLESGENKIATIEGVGNYTGTREVEYTIGSSITNAQYTVADPYTHETYSAAKDGGQYYIDYIGNKRPEIKLTLSSGTVTLEEGVDYDISYYSDTYQSAEDADTYNTKGSINKILATVTGKGDYYGSFVIDYRIQPVDFNNESKTFDVTDANNFTKVYDGENIVPALTIKYNTMTLIEGTDYTLDVKTAGPNVGRYVVTVTGIGNYYGTMVKQYQITEANLSDYTIADIEDQIYTGKKIAPSVVVSKDGVALTLDKDYEVSYSNNINVGEDTATVTVTGKGNYAGTITKNFSIVTRDITGNANLTFSSIEDQTYTGYALTPEFNVYYDGKQLVKGVDYEITTWDNNTKLGEATVNIKGIGTFSGTNSTKFKIVGDITNGSLFTVKSSTDKFNATLTSAGKLDVTGLEKAKFKVYYNDVTSGELTTATVPASNYSIAYICEYPGNCSVSVIGNDYLTGTTSVNVAVVGNLNDVQVVGLRDYYDYTGSAIKPTNFVVTYNGNVLTNGTDYEIAYGENNSIGDTSGTIVIKNINSNPYFTGSKAVTFPIKYDLANVTVSGVEPSYPYTGTQYKPAVTVTGADGNPVPSDKYKIEYGENINAGKGSVTVSPAAGQENAVTGSKTVEFDIVGLDISAATISDVSPSYEYTGELITPSPKVVLGSKTLTEGTDYTVNYANNMNAGDASLTIIGCGNYYGTKSQSFAISAVDFAKVTFTVNDVGYAGGKNVTPNVNVSYKGRTLTNDVDYTVAFSNNTVVTDHALAVFTAKGGNYTGNKTVEFKVTQVNLLGGTVSLENSSETYTGSAIVPKVTVTCPIGGSNETYTLTEGNDYEITYNGSGTIKDAGNYNIIVTGKGGFYNSLNTTFVVEPRSVDDAEWISAEVVEDNDYTGQAVEPKVTVKNIKLTGTAQTLVEGTDYTVVYSNNVSSAGKDEENAPTATITGIGNYGGTLTKTFNIGKSIADATVNISPTKFTYDGKKHIPSSYSVYLGSNLLKEGVDYELVDVEDPINAGTKTFAVKGIGNYYGTPSKEYTIAQKSANLNKIRIVLDGLQQDSDGKYYEIYNGKDFEPGVTVYDDEISTTTPIAEENYSFEYVNNHDVSTGGSKANVIVHLKGNYAVGADTKVVEFEIRQKDITEGFEINFEEDRIPYTGNEITPVFTVDYNDGMNPTVTLTPDDYDLELTDNINAGTATATVNAKGNYTGTVSKEFIIYGNLEDAQVNVPTQFYTGEAINPPVEVICGGNTLVQGEDFDVIYNESETQGVATITPLSQFYTGTVSVAYDIKFDPTLLKVEGYANEMVYTGSEIKPDFKILMPNDQEIEYDADSVVYTDANGGTDLTNVGEITAEIPLEINGQDETLTVTYKIIPKNINSCTVTQLINNTYVASALNPPVTIVYNNEELESGKDYTATYSNNTFPGTATVEIVGTGNFTGTKSMHFSIISPAVVSLTAKAQSTSAINLSWTIFGKPTGYQIYSQDCKVLYGTTTGNSYVVSGLNPQTSYTFKVRSYVVQGGKTTFGAWREITASTQVSKTTATGATSSSSKKATISWNASSEVGGYEIYRSETSNGNYTKIAVMPSSVTSYTNTGLTSGKTYYYIVRAYKKVDGVYVYGSYSDVMSITVK